MAGFCPPKSSIRLQAVFNVIPSATLSPVSPVFPVSLESAYPSCIALPTRHVTQIKMF